jgi:hypothetical protein
VQAQHLLGLHQLRDDGHRLHVGAHVPDRHGAVGQVDQRLDRLRPIAIQQHHLGLPRRQLAARLPAQQGVLVRLGQVDGDEPAALAAARESGARPGGRCGRANFFGGQGVQGMNGHELLMSVHPIPSMAQ